MTYTVIITPAVRRKLKRLSRSDKKRVLDKIDSLADDPRPYGYKDLVGYKDFYRIRVGNLRIIYQIVDATLIVTVADLIDRGDGYR